jgi:hypothetical protein
MADRRLYTVNVEEEKQLAACKRPPRWSKPACASVSALVRRLPTYLLNWPGGMSRRCTSRRRRARLTRLAPSASWSNPLMSWTNSISASMAPTRFAQRLAHQGGWRRADPRESCRRIGRAFYRHRGLDQTGWPSARTGTARTSGLRAQIDVATTWQHDIARRGPQPRRRSDLRLSRRRERPRGARPVALEHARRHWPRTLRTRVGERSARRNRQYCSTIN